MTKIYSYTVPLEANAVDAFCALQKGFTDQFVYYDKERPFHMMGLGRCIALSSLDEAEIVIQSHVDKTAVFFSFNRFDEHNPSPADEMMQAFPQLKLMLPELVLIEDADGSFLQVNSLGPVYEGRVERFVKHAHEAPPHKRHAIAYQITPVRPTDQIVEQGLLQTVTEGSDSSVIPAPHQTLMSTAESSSWEDVMALTLSAIREGRVAKLVPSRRQYLSAAEPFSSKDVLVNLIDGPSRGTVFMYRYGDVFFCGCTPELLVRKSGSLVTSMCLAGTTEVGETIEDSKVLADELLHDDKNLREHSYVVQFMREVFSRNCYHVDIPDQPSILTLKHIQHLCTPVHAHVMEGKTLLSLAEQLHPTPALAGYPVGEALMCLREIEPYNRGFFGGAVGVVDGKGDGEFSVAIRSGVFDGEQGYIYAGCGVVEGSQMAEEFSETDLKLKTILSAFEGV